MADVLVPLGDGVHKLRLKDMGDGSYAMVVASATSGTASSGDVLVDAGDGVTKLRMRDMGDGTVASVVYVK